ncbi:NDUFAF1 [Lepeophtheirus salmonis]|uniref:NDUFAF1 n=1 Tax=Lepeophtheirus salmonis TaxID=72036 RepID=A0A7R8CF02_LEPSM|nr:NDUFAF1 [Lepeophtheirus salmonis]CAF2801280.1 NDUFAF1 [Lepeophtheirus salmonis]
MRIRDPQSLKLLPRDSLKNTPTLGERIRRDRNHMFHEYDRKGGYYDGPTGTFRDHIGDPSVKETVVQGAGILKDEILKWKTEMSYNELEEWPKPGDRKYLIHSDKPQESREIVCISDSNWGEGFSSCSMSKNPSTGKHHFTGELSSRVPRDGRTAFAGYVNFSTKKTLKSFFRVKPLEWHLYTHLVLRIRGDGRVYMLNVNTWEEYDIAWQDLYTYPLYTRGGPYWQEVKIPFFQIHIYSSWCPSRQSNSSYKEH